MATSAVPRKARPHQAAEQPPPRASLKQDLIRQLACGDSVGARKTRLLLAESNARANGVQPRNCHAVLIEDGRVVETVKMTATPGARALFASAEEAPRKLA